jgi:hypothetical protein
MKYITVDSVGNIMGMYLSEEDIPTVSGITTAELSDEDWQSVGPGYTYVDGVLIAPTPKTPEEILAEQNAGKVAVNTAKKAELIATATDRISVLQDAVDLDMATDNEITMLKTWKAYRVLLSRINASVAESISWPSAPDE